MLRYRWHAWKAKELMPLTSFASLPMESCGAAALGRYGGCFEVEAALSRLAVT